MSRFGSADVNFLLISGRDVLGDTTNLEDERQAITEETTTLGQAAEEHTFVGVKRYTLSQQGYYSDAVNASNEALVTAGSSGVLSFATEGNTIGKPVICSAMVQTNYVRQISRGALHKANASYLSEQLHDEAIILHALSAETADGNTDSSSVDNAASSSAGGTAYLQVTALDLDGYDSVTITVTDDTNNSGFGDLVAFTTVTAAPFAERVTVTGTVERYLSVKWDFVGTGTSPSITFLVGFARN